ncbi:malonate decarboxylase holo-[acyl-carrier-protein] synthase [Undibacterium sp. Rencai35W]|uniref:malonate decarboxylase holo-[acyl-carrier-protein] synthase n=1 Tax=Undibacterium sp. Rencai35W TaxID=3413046 RepID=UPI003BF23FB1
MYSRHDLVWLSDHGWQQAGNSATPEHRHAIETWRLRDWPLIVRRHDADAGDEVVCLGLALPPNNHDGNKQRIALRVEKTLIARSSPALSLRNIIETAPREWQQALTHFSSLSSLPVTLKTSSSPALDMRVFGSTALQRLTGLSYVTARSDIDLLFSPKNLSELEQGLSLLTSFSKLLPLDGEILFPQQQAVSWREWQLAISNQARVLVKTMHTVYLASTASLIASLAQNQTTTGEFAA